MLFVLHFTLLVESCRYVGLFFFGVCEVLLFNVLSRSVFSFFRRGSLDESVLRSVTVEIIFILQWCMLSKLFMFCRIIIVLLTFWKVYRAFLIDVLSCV